jgi:bla regulator protein BlaR1
MNPTYSDALLRALGWTLAHSVWQGAALTLLLMALLPRVRAAAQRYRLAYGALMGLWVVSMITFWQVFEPHSATEVTMGFTPVVEEAGNMLQHAIAPEPGFWSVFSAGLEQQYPVIVAVWAFGFGLFLLRLALGFLYLKRLRRTSRLPEDDAWQFYLQDLSERLAFSKPVQLLESALVRMPVALGFFRPIILVPIGMVNRLSVQEVEAVLAHELAHIARHDWLLNLMQAFVEALFYYHPAVWWISGVIRREREHCCDDAAVYLTGNRLAYAKALVQVQEMARSAATPALALGMAGNARLLRRRPLLLDRIRRVLNQPQPKSHIMEKLIATGVLLALLTFFGIRNNAPQAFAGTLQKLEAMQAGLFGPQTDQESAVSDSIPKPSKKVQKITRDDGNQKVELELKNGEITRLNIDGKEIPAEQYEQYSDLTDDLLNVPPPPTPPSPPDFPGFEAPPAPAMPPSPLYPPNPPSPPSRISTEKDEAGNTIIRIERHGKPTEIKVKDGLVFIDGNELKTGQSLDLKGESEFYMFDAVPGAGIPGFETPNYAIAPEGHFPARLYNEEELQQIKTLSELSELSNIDFEKQAQAFKKEHRHWSKEQKRAFALQLHELRKQQREAHYMNMDAQRLQQESMRLQMDAKRMAEEARLYQLSDERRAALFKPFHAKTEALSKRLTAQLMADGLIKDPEHLNLHISEDEMVVNGEKQSKQTLRKYKALFKEISGNELKGRNEYNIR